MKAKVEAARKAYDKTSAAIFALAPNGQTRFSECLALASEELRAKHDAAQTKLVNLEHEAVSKGKAWRASFGMLTWYR